uniref:Uncharacterized protein n=1 Tax=Glossina pallidipes TaxID=7398 RepID=A0A1A9Z8B5_GLOPL
MEGFKKSFNNGTHTTMIMLNTITAVVGFTFLRNYCIFTAQEDAHLVDYDRLIPIVLLNYILTLTRHGLRVLSVSFSITDDRWTDERKNNWDLVECRILEPSEMRKIRSMERMDSWRCQIFLVLDAADQD